MCEDERLHEIELFFGGQVAGSVKPSQVDWNAEEPYWCNVGCSLSMRVSKATKVKESKGHFPVQETLVTAGDEAPNS